MRVLGFTAQGTATDVAFTVQLLAGAESPPRLLTADITAHNEIESHWVASFPISRQVDTDIWSGAVTWSPEEAPDLLSLAGLQIPPPMPPDVGSIPPTMPESVALEGDFILKKPDGDGTGHWLDGSARLKDLVATRESYFDAELRAPSAAATDPLWCVAILAEHVLLTSPTRVPGLRILPLQPNTNEDRLAATAGLLTALAAEVGMTTPGRITFNANDRPLALVVAPRLRASTGPHAMQEAAHMARRLLDIVCLNRGDSPAVVAAAVGRHQPDGTIELEGATTLDRRYMGNLIGGFISGESTSGLNSQWTQAQADPRIFLWLRLLNEALTDSRWDYRVFRCFNLLEGIAQEVLPKKQPVLDATGAPRLQADGKTPYSSNLARGAVFLLLEKAGHVMPHVGLPDGSSGQADLWDETGLWVSIRNEVAHTGSWEKPAGQVASGSWTKHNRRLGSPIERAEVARELQSAAESVMHAAFGGSI